jgi:hypothetical protein
MGNRSLYVSALLVMLALTIFALSGQASIVPPSINYQGYLTKSDGTPVTAPVNMSFSLYSTATGKSPLWTELHTAVPVNNGIYSVVLGSTTPIDVSLNANYFLGTQVGTDPEMTPRQPLTSVPFALRAGCNPGDMIACYTGDISTLNTPPNAAGTRTCNPQGTGFGPCVGEITPNTPSSTAPATVTVSANINSAPADGSTPITFTINVKNSAATALPAVPLTISTNGGTLSATTAVTDPSGNATVTLTSSAAGTPTVSVSATASGVTETGTAQVTFTSLSGRPTTATVKVGTTGTLPSGTTIGTVLANLKYPTTKGLTPTSAVISGSGAGSTFTPLFNDVTGEITLMLTNVTGIPTGEFVTITFTIASGTPVPVASDFAVAPGATVTDTSDNPLSNISVSVLSAILQ